MKGIDIHSSHFDDTVRDGYFLYDGRLVFIMDYEYNDPNDCGNDYKIYMVRDVYDELIGFFKLNYVPKEEGSRIYVYGDMVSINDYTPVSKQCQEPDDGTILVRVKGRKVKVISDLLEELKQEGHIIDYEVK